MGWLRSVGSIKSYVSFAEYRLFCMALLQKRPIILSILLSEATPYLSRRWGNRAAVPHALTPQPHHTLIYRQWLQHTLIQTHTHHSRRNRGNRPPLRRGNRAVVPQINHSSSTHSYTHSRTTAEAHTHTHTYTHTHTHHSRRNRGDHPLRRWGNRAAVPHIYRSHSTHSYAHTHTTAAAYTHTRTRAKVHIRTPYTHTHTLYLQYTLSHTHIYHSRSTHSYTLTHTHHSRRNRGDHPPRRRGNHAAAPSPVASPHLGSVSAVWLIQICAVTHSHMCDTTRTCAKTHFAIARVSDFISSIPV